MMKVYVASSWRNYRQPTAVRLLKPAGHEVYDFRDDGFSWREIDPDWQSWDLGKYLHALQEPAAQRGFAKDLDAMLWADAFLLVNPCDRSAHLELGWAIGAGKPSAIWLSDEDEADLMYKLAGKLCITIEEVLSFFSGRGEGTLGAR